MLVHKNSSPANTRKPFAVAKVMERREMLGFARIFGLPPCPNFSIYFACRSTMLLTKNGLAVRRNGYLTRLRIFGVQAKIGKASLVDMVIETGNKWLFEENFTQFKTYCNSFEQICSLWHSIVEH